MSRPSARPVATYRVQFHEQFTFAAARALIPYLHRLGVTHLYASPVFRARPGSTHGYDVLDPRALNPELGSREDLDALAATLAEHEMSLILDIVPNHMAAESDNPWWYRVCRDGAASPSARFFDIDWDTPSAAFPHRLLLPMLGRPYGEALEQEELSLEATKEGLHLRYFDKRVPLDPGTYPMIWPAPEELASAPAELQSLVARCRSLGPASEKVAGSVSDLRSKEAERLACAFGALYLGRSDVKAFVDRTIGKKLRGSDLSRLDALLQAQPYRVVFWKMASEHVNYRRFFDITDLAAVRVEDPEVFETTHALVFSLLEAGTVVGLRIDHVDGLADPGAYLAKLERRAPLILVEKILSADERLPTSWPAHGTTGYDFLNEVNAVFVDPEGLESLQQCYRELTGRRDCFEELGYRKKREVLTTLFRGEVRTLVVRLRLLAQRDRHACDLARQELERALVAVSAALPVYRTYRGSRFASGQDDSFLERAFCDALRRNPDLRRAIDFLRRAIAGDEVRSGDPHEIERAQWVNKWQQLTGPAAAKGIEDTALYVYNRLLSLNEVGSEPDEVRRPVERFHQKNGLRREQWPLTLNASSTHDTKRSEDARVRLDVLSEIPDSWSKHVARWYRLNRSARRVVNGRLVPESNDEYHLYQTLVAVWPLAPGELPGIRSRIKEYIVKALREGKEHSSWWEPDLSYERGVCRFVDRVLRRSPDNVFLKDFERFVRRVAFHGALNALAQLALKVTSPGVPDFYQGCELWSFRLVDPDNRAPVDFALRERWLRRMREGGSSPEALSELLASWTDGRVKLFLTARALAFRRECSSLFLEGTYHPLWARGSRARHVVAFARRHNGEWGLVVVPRLTTGLTRAGKMPLGETTWQKTQLLVPPESPRSWRNVLTGERLELARSQRSLALHRIFRRFPVALLAGSLASTEESSLERR